ncbi:MAG: type II toxin-antitoxin system HicA family toxin [Desulfovibrionaceae bacterium]
MNNQQQKTLKAIFARPVLKSIIFAQVESLLVALGCELIEGNGSRVAFKKGAQRLDVHRPHPGKEAKPYQIQAVREFLEAIGVHI